MCELNNLDVGQRNALLNCGIQQAMGLASNVSLGGTMGILQNPFEIPQQLVLSGTIPAASTKTYFAVDDAVGLGVAFGQIDVIPANPTTGIEFVAAGGIDVENLKKFLQTHALVMVGYNFESSKASQLTQNLRIIYSTLDGNTKSKQMFSAQSVSNMQQNPNLLNVDQSFVYTNNGALKINVVADAIDAVVFTFTFKIGGAVPYGKLDEFLAIAKIPERSRMSC